MSVIAETHTGTVRVCPARHEAAVHRRHASATAADTVWSPDHPVLTAAGRRLLAHKAEELRTAVLPALRVAVTDPHCDGHTEAVYVNALGELRQLDAILAEAEGISPGKNAPSLVELGDRVTVEFLDTGSQRVTQGVHEEGSVEDFLLVHPVERLLDNQRMSASSPLARAVLGRTIGNVVHVAAPAGSYPVRILAAKRPSGSRTKVTRRTSPPANHDDPS